MLDVTCYNLAPNRDTGRLDEEKVVGDLDRVVCQTPRCPRCISSSSGPALRQRRAAILSLDPGCNRAHLHLPCEGLTCSYTFLEEILPLYELYLYTHGTREYAIRLLKALDPSARYFGCRRLVVTTTVELMLLAPPRLIARPTQSALTCKVGRRAFVAVQGRWSLRLCRGYSRRTTG